MKTIVIAFAMSVLAVSQLGAMDTKTVDACTIDFVCNDAVTLATVNVPETALSVPTMTQCTILRLTVRLRGTRSRRLLTLCLCRRPILPVGLDRLWVAGWIR